MSRKRTVSKVMFPLLLSALFCVGQAAPVLAQSPMQYKAPVLSTTLPRATPESKGVSSEYILDMLNEIEKRNLQIDSIAMAVDGNVIFDAYAYPYNRNTPFITFSLSKLFAVTAVGLAYTEGKLKLSDRPVDYFPGNVPANASDNLKAMTVRDLLTMRSGHDREISGNEWRSLNTSWIDHFMKEPVPHMPGNFYKYSSGNTFMLSAMVQKVMGKDIEALLKENLLSKMGIKQFITDKSPEGIVSGFGGIMVTTEDLLKIGILYQQKGMWNGERLLTEEWCDLGLGIKNVYEDNRPLSYFFHWSDRAGVYQAGGRFGQSVLIVPHLKMVVAITGSVESRRYGWEYSAALQGKVVSPITLDGKKEYDGKYADTLRKKGEHFSVVGETRVTDSPLAAKLNGKTFVIEKNEDGVSEITLGFNDDAVAYQMKDARGIHTVKNGIGYWKPGITTMTGNYLHHQSQNPEHSVYAAAEWLDDATLKLTWQFTDMPFCDYLILKLTDSTLSMVRSVNVNSTGPFGGQVRPEIQGKLR